MAMAVRIPNPPAAKAKARFQKRISEACHLTTCVSASSTSSCSSAHPGLALGGDHAGLFASQVVAQDIEEDVVEERHHLAIDRALPGLQRSERRNQTRLQIDDAEAAIRDLQHIVDGARLARIDLPGREAGFLEAAAQVDQERLGRVAVLGLGRVDELAHERQAAVDLIDAQHTGGHPLSVPVLGQHAGQIAAIGGRPEGVLVRDIRERRLERDPVERAREQSRSVDLGDRRALEEHQAGQRMGMRRGFVVIEPLRLDQRQLVERASAIRHFGQRDCQHATEQHRAEHVARPVRALPDAAERGGGHDDDRTGLNRQPQRAMLDAARQQEDESIEEHGAFDVTAREGALLEVEAGALQLRQMRAGALDQQLTDDGVEHAADRHERHRQRGGPDPPGGERHRGQRPDRDRPDRAGQMTDVARSRIRVPGDRPPGSA